MTVEAIKDAIIHLSEPERKQLSDWLGELEEEAWDRQMEQDFAPGGRGAHLIAEVDADIAAGRFQPMEEFLAEARFPPRVLPVSDLEPNPDRKGRDGPIV